MWVRLPDCKKLSYVLYCTVPCTEELFTVFFGAEIQPKIIVFWYLGFLLFLPPYSQTSFLKLVLKTMQSLGFLGFVYIIEDIQLNTFLKVSQ